MYEKHLDTFVNIAKRFIRTDSPTILEIGVMDCEETLAFRQHFPHSKIFSFECNPDILPLCREKATAIGNVTLVEKALTDKIGEISFFKTENLNDGSWNPGASSIYRANEEYPIEKYVQKEVRVPSSTLEAEMQRLSVGKAELLWTDIQGAELKMLKGAGDFIRNLSLIHTEVEFHEQYHDQPLFKDVQAYLNSRGFSLLTFTTMGKYAGDAVFINKNLYRRITPEWTTVWYFRTKEKVTGKFRGLILKLKTLENGKGKKA